MDLLIFGLSHHFQEPRPEEEVAEYRVQSGIGLQWRQSEDLVDFTVTGAVYQNSLDKTSIAFGPGFRTKGDYGIEASGMLITGYYNIPVLVPIAGVFYRYDRVTVHVNYMEALVLYVGVEL